MYVSWPQPAFRAAAGDARDTEKTFPQLSALFEQHKELRTLFVPVAELATSRMLLTMQGTALHNAYAAIKSASAKARKQ